jgi:hypothetical protein
MTNDDRALERLLTLAQLGATPSIEQQARSFERLEASRQPLALIQGGVPAPSAPFSPDGSLRAAGVLRPLLWAGAVAGFAAVVGYWMASATAQPPFASAAFVGVRATPGSASLEVSAPVSSEPPKPLVDTPPPAAASAPERPLEKRRSPPSRARSAPATPRPAALRPAALRPAALRPAPAALDLEPVLRRLRLAQSALRDGNAAAALGELDRLDADVPLSVLAEERLMTRVLAACGAGQRARAVELARSLLQMAPRSVYGGRLAQTCAADNSALLEELRRWTPN